MNPSFILRYGRWGYRLALPVLAVALFALSACLEQIDFDVPADLESAIVIQGKLVKGDPSTVRVEVSALFSFSGSSRRLIDVREVALLDETGAALTLPAIDIGVYALEIPANHPTFAVESGRAYRVRVVTQDGRTYESLPDRLYPVPQATALSAEIIEEEVFNAEGESDFLPLIQFSIDTPLRTAEGSDPPRLRWESFRTYRLTDVSENQQTCYITEPTNVGRLNLLDAGEFGAEGVEDLPIAKELIIYYFAEGYYLTVHQEALSPEAYRYWNEVGELLERSGSIFEPPAGKVKSNFRNTEDPDDEVFGLFYAVEQDTIRLYVSPEFAGNEPPHCPPPVGPGGLDGSHVCADCLENAPVSTLTRPGFWVE